MDLVITGWAGAVEYVPRNRTYAIRIHSAIYPFKFELQSSGLWTVAEYTFDDIVPDYTEAIRGGARLFDAGIAERLLRDFRERGLDKDTLLVHCGKGENRSPAVGIALNELFGLGNDSERLKEIYSEANWYIYRLLLEVGKRA